MIALFLPGSGKHSPAGRLARALTDLKAALNREATYKAAVDTLQEDLADAERELGDCNRELAAQGQEIETLKAENARLLAERNEARGRSNHHLALLKAATARAEKAEVDAEEAAAEVARLNALLKPVQNLSSISAPAPADDPGSCFNQPDPAPVTPGPRIIPDAPEGPVDSEAADVNAKTQAVNVRTLREALGVDETQLMPVTWGTEVSATTGKVAQASVRVALTDREAS